jgi:hypothetical protein
MAGLFTFFFKAKTYATNEMAIISSLITVPAIILRTKTLGLGVLNDRCNSKSVIKLLINKITLAAITTYRSIFCFFKKERFNKKNVLIKMNKNIIGSSAFLFACMGYFLLIKYCKFYYSLPVIAGKGKIVQAKEMN